MGSTGHALGLSTVAGDQNEVMFVFGYASMDEMEKDFDRVDQAFAGSMKAEADVLRKTEGAVHERQRAMIGIFRPDLSYRADSVALEKVRYVFTNQHLIKFGGDVAYAADCKFVASICEKADVDRHWWIYAIVAGAPTGTGIRIEPMKALADLDLVNGGALRAKLAAVATEEDLKRLTSLWKDYTVQEPQSAGVPGSPNVTLFAVAPKMSYMPKEIVEKDPAFWAPKSEAAGKAPERRKAK